MLEEEIPNGSVLRPLELETTEDSPRCFGTPGSNVFTLWTIFALTATFTVLQSVGAYFANSLSMMGDSITMVVDCVTYLLNIYTEIQKSEIQMTHGEQISSSSKLEKYVTVVSGLSLLVVTSFLMYDASSRLISESGIDPVNPFIMLGFTLVNLIINIVGCLTFSGLCEKKDYRKVDRHSLNMTSAFVHLVADTMRTLTVLSSSLVVLLTSGDAVEADAIGSLVVSTLIIFAVLFLFVEVCNTTLGTRYSQVDGI